MGEHMSMLDILWVINIEATFRRVMDVIFDGLIDKVVIIYKDSLTLSSKDKNDQYKHLEFICGRLLEYDISLNPKKCAFGIKEGKFIGHIVSKYGVGIYLYGKNLWI
jgi:flavodoxin